MAPRCDAAYLRFWTAFPAPLHRAIAADELRPGQSAFFDVSRRPHQTSLTHSEEENASTVIRLSRGSLAGWQGFDWMIQGKGRWSGFRILVNSKERPPKGDKDDRFKVIVMLSAEYLASEWGDGRGVYEAWHAWLDTMEEQLLRYRPDDKDVRVSRIDICVDHWRPWTEPCRWSDATKKDLNPQLWIAEDMRKMATKSRTRGTQQGGTQYPDAVWRENAWTWESKTGTTYYVGKRGAKSRHLRIYDKIAEAKTHGTAHFWKDFFTAQGWDNSAVIWRAEVEHGSEWCKDHALETAADLPDCEATLWAHFVQEGCRHVEGNRQRLRENESSLKWQQLQNAGKLNPKAPWQYQPRPPRCEDGNYEHVRAMAAGCVRRLAGVYEPLVGDELLPAGSRQVFFYHPTELGRVDLAMVEVRQLIEEHILAELAGTRAPKDYAPDTSKAPHGYEDGSTDHLSPEQLGTLHKMRALDLILARRPLDEEEVA